MEVIVDRFEGDYAIIELDIGKFVSVPKELFPNAKEGDIVDITILHSKTEERKDKIKNLMDELFVD